MRRVADQDDVAARPGTAGDPQRTVPPPHLADPVDDPLESREGAPPGVLVDRDPAPGLVVDVAAQAHVVEVVGAGVVEQPPRPAPVLDDLGGRVAVDPRDQQPGIALVQIVHPTGEQHRLADPGEGAVGDHDQVGWVRRPVLALELALRPGRGHRGARDDLDAQRLGALDQCVVQVGARRQDQTVPDVELASHQDLVVLVLGDERLDRPSPLGGLLLDAEGGERTKAVLPQPDPGPEHAQLG